MMDALKNHWPEYLMEAAGLCVFMLSACAFGALIFHPSSIVRARITDPLLQRMLMGAMMGLTATAIIYSPWGKRSGAHINPSTTLTFLRLGKVKPEDALFYVLAQFAGGLMGVLVASLLLGRALAAPPVAYVKTLPGTRGAGVAFVAEAVITFMLMSVVLVVSNTHRLRRWTGICVGLLVAIYISLEAPLSGMSMNPARTFASAFAARDWTALWVYFTAPPTGMLCAAEAYARLRGARRVACAKLHHDNRARCIFNCEFERQSKPDAQVLDANGQRRLLPVVPLQLF